MQRVIGLGLALVAGALFGATAVSKLQAQSKAPGAYVIVDIAEITNPDVFKTLGPKAGPAAAAAGGQFVARTDNVIALDGTTPPKRFVIIGFDSIDKAKAFWASPAQQEVAAINKSSAKSRNFIVEGMSN